MKKVIKVGSRSSELALVQTQMVINEIKKFRQDFEFEIVKITTQGDALIDKPISEIGGKGVFVKEIESALLKGEIDMAVHSLKDMPYETPEGLKLIPVLKREDPRDVFISKDGTQFMNLKEGAKIGTSSLRRQVQLKDLRSDMQTIPIRGNIKTRLRKIEELNLDGIVLSAAGLHRLGLESIITEYFPPDVVVPAPCQGILAVEIAESFDNIFQEFYSYIVDRRTFFEASIERELLKVFGVNCRQPFGAYAQYRKERDEEKINIKVVYQKEDKLLKSEVTGLIEETDKMIEKLIEEFGGI
ncbi:porphobilinogen deaminase [Thermoanaerobacter italicus Ab9]|uniref:Porphobilinogen deaminase n=1 Tax=Thermoanaerobacter italicus (strain DSM 9252 / Ab9) TaxID=580331 RepID=D3T6R3_THEIA|nr:hydroxymethylbilane synthase [Thermoanaerobacter italicus]ADD01676.1 porphobilinogen deaminase [Thermoanaerobacter italicus Ab9]